MITEISILSFWTAFFGAVYARNLWLPEEEPLEARLRRIMGHEKAAIKSPDLVISRTETPSTRRLRQRLLMSGLHRKSDLDRAVAFRRLCLLIPFVLACLLFFMGFPMPQVFAAGLLFSVIFVVIPRFWMIRTIFKRRRELERHLPNALDLLVLCLEAGLSFDSALVRVAEEQKRVSTQISRELIFTNQEILAGKSREEALRNLAWRTQIEDIKRLVGSIQQSLKLGTSLVKTLRTQAEVLRKKRRERLRALILKTPVKLIFPLMFFIFPILLVVILAPSMINIFRHLSAVGV